MSFFRPAISFQKLLIETRPLCTGNSIYHLSFVRIIQKAVASFIQSLLKKWGKKLPKVHIPPVSCPVLYQTRPPCWFFNSINIKQPVRTSLYGWIIEGQTRCVFETWHSEGTSPRKLAEFKHGSWSLMLQRKSKQGERRGEKIKEPKSKHEYSCHKGPGWKKNALVQSRNRKHGVHLRDGMERGWTRPSVLLG